MRGSSCHVVRCSYHQKHFAASRCIAQRNRQIPSRRVTLGPCPMHSGFFGTCGVGTTNLRTPTRKETLTPARMTLASDSLVQCGMTQMRMPPSSDAMVACDSSSHSQQVMRAALQRHGPVLEPRGTKTFSRWNGYKGDGAKSCGESVNVL